jgi:outer membrane lipoprotein-sorting protein
MERTVYAKLTFCILLVLTVSSLCAGQSYTLQPFSADIRVVGKNASENMTGKYYFSPPSFRMDANAKGHNVSSIIDGNTQTSYVIMHDQRMYMEMHTNQPSPMMFPLPKVENAYDLNKPCAAARRGGTCQKVGAEMINGRLCDKWQGVSALGTDTLWLDQKLHIPMKVVGPDGRGMELSNVEEGKVDASVFRPPDGYRKMDLGVK